MPRIKEISDNFSNRNGKEETLLEFTNRIIADETKNTAVGGKLFFPETSTIDANDTYRFLTDKGNGRIYDGIRSLELMTRIIAGHNSESTLFFDNKIIAYTATDMKTASPVTARIIINSNIGITNIYEYAVGLNLSEVATYNVFLDKLARRIKAGSFKTEDTISEALIRVKALIRAALNEKGIT